MIPAGMRPSVTSPARPASAAPLARPPRPARALACGVALFVSASALATDTAVPPPRLDLVRTVPATERSGERSLSEVAVRRWEYVILVRVDPAIPGSIGRAEIAAQTAGGAVLEEIRSEGSASHDDYRMLVRTRDPDVVHQVVRAVRATRGVLGAAAQPLPETPTYPGGPGFFESYRAVEDLTPGNAGRVVMRHDVPPIADKKELLEYTELAGSPSTGPDGAGGFTLNISELFKRMKEGAWRRREERLRNTPIEILPSAPEGSATAP